MAETSSHPPLRPPLSWPMVASVLVAFAALYLYLSTDSPFVLILPVLFLASLLLPYRFERDSGSIWGVRLLIYAAFAVLGRTPSGAPGYFVDAQAFTTAGLIAGSELVLQAFRTPPQGARYDPWIVSLSGVIFLIACNTFRTHIWFLAPLYVMFLLLSLADLRPRARANCAFSTTRRVLTILVTVALGAALHQTLWANRGSIMAVGARLISSNAVSDGGNDAGGTPQLSDSFGGNTSTARLFRIAGTLSDSHLRAATFDTYRNGTWGPPLSRRLPLDSALPNETREEMTAVVKGEVVSTGVDRPRTSADAKITVLRETGGVLFMPLNAWAILPENGQSFDWNRFQGPVTTVEPAPVSYYIINSKTQLFDAKNKRNYDFQTEQGPLCVSLNRPNELVPDVKNLLKLAQTRAQLTTVPPEIDPQVSRLARRVAKNGATPAEKAAMLVDYLFKTNKYSLTFERGAGEPISDFVLNKRAAHCQYFASSLVIMLRSVGIPARYVSGYYAHEAEAGGTTVVRGRDAHAWAEAYLQNIGWVALDATPAAGRADPAVKPLPVYQKWVEKMEDLFARVRAWFGQLTQLQIGGIVVLILVLWGLERARQTWVKSRRRSALPVPPPQLAPLARRFEKWIARRGVTLETNRPWSESVPPEMEEARDWVESYNRARFDEIGADEVRNLERELERLEK
ncbi:Transglutaminase-like superfamily protein [Abditibacterium utsteinense]|uniref:Transglutaminase-like superfamily protein n=1 Tax=Abditibacterium utsteinense TaxID=1960156 RepID=A0A2S8SV67_9BACT|nr:transglutaminase domain-containing protein [Abditibacterium utsteinense]PQV64698.1 Transglutaminase-like superfamily protein [Abditibacterium utsteinense]